MLTARQQELLTVLYFHVVFTLPHELNILVRANPALLYNLLFQASAQTLREVAADPKHLGAEIGFFSILHIWVAVGMPVARHAPPRTDPYVSVDSYGSYLG